MPISEETREFVDDIDDPVVKMELVHLMSTVDAINAGAGGDLRSEEFCRAFDRSMEGYMQQVSNQRASISRLLAVRDEQMKTIKRLQSENTIMQAKLLPGGVGPE